MRLSPNPSVRKLLRRALRVMTTADKPGGGEGTSRYPARAPEPAGLAVRKAALRLIDAVVRRGQPLETALHAATQGLRLPADRSLAHAIVAETLRRLPDLDALIDGSTQRALPDDAKARMVLRLALTQALVLGTPAHAVVATALPLVDGGPRKLVHGVLGSLLREGATLPEAITLPTALSLRWDAQWGADMTAAAAAALGTRPPLDLSLRDAGLTEAVAATTGGVSLAPGHIRLPPETDVTTLPGFAEGQYWVQDIAASIPARLLGAGAGRRALDLCAAPGGKAMQLAAAGWAVTAVDKSARRLERMRANLDRTGLAMDLVTADLLAWSPQAPVDAVLLDAPCSATGIFRRHPDVLHRVGHRQIAEMAEVQAQLLARTADWVLPGGRLVYAVCSLEQAEGEDQIVRFLSDRPDFSLVPPWDNGLPTGISADPRGWIRTGPQSLPDLGRADGFFIALLARASAH